MGYDSESGSSAEKCSVLHVILFCFHSLWPLLLLFVVVPMRDRESAATVNTWYLSCGVVVAESIRLPLFATSRCLHVSASARGV